ncbi:putative F-box protein At1g67623 [Rutidosis leptorrhynchoides]|uniref:putative F-box protein At1g67623 n=1 Tax=Rutidosis leptorrhynchoides TaxID=125765 RepID=UPI003A99D374
MDVDEMNILEHLPQEMIIEILSRVGSSSCVQLFSAKTACKSFLMFFKDPLVVKRISLDNYSAVPWGNTMVSFYNRCLVSGNPQAIFQLGLHLYFDAKDIQLGLQKIKEDTNHKILDSVYVYGLIMFASNQNEAKNIGLEMLNQIFSARSLDLVVAVRRKVFAMLRDLWKTNRHQFTDLATHCPLTRHKPYLPN